MSAWLWADAGATDDEVPEEADGTEDDAEGAASLVAELLHAPIAAVAASAATPVSTVLVLFTNLPLSGRR